jgi:hypothetical protein
MIISPAVTVAALTRGQRQQMNDRFRNVLALRAETVPPSLAESSKKVERGVSVIPGADIAHPSR